MEFYSSRSSIDIIKVVLSISPIFMLTIGTSKLSDVNIICIHLLFRNMFWTPSYNVYNITNIECLGTRLFVVFLSRIPL